MEEIMEMISIEMLDNEGVLEMYDNDFDKLLERRDYYYNIQKEYSQLSYWNTYKKLEDIVYNI